MALDATVGGTASTSYVTVAQATALLQAHLDTQAWYAQLPSDEVTLVAKREAALMTATRFLDTQMTWAGSPTTDTQSLGWPRTGVTTRQGRTVDPLTVPVAVQEATAFYALALLEESSISVSGVEAGSVKRTVMGETSIEYFQPSSTATSATPASRTMPAEVRDLLRGYGVSGGGVMVTLIRA
jgi:hypothetical protein